MSFKNILQFKTFESRANFQQLLDKESGNIISLDLINDVFDNVNDLRKCSIHKSSYLSENNNLGIKINITINDIEPALYTQNKSISEILVKSKNFTKLLEEIEKSVGMLKNRLIRNGSIKTDVNLSYSNTSTNFTIIIISLFESDLHSKFVSNSKNLDIPSREKINLIIQEIVIDFDQNNEYNKRVSEEFEYVLHEMVDELMETENKFIISQIPIILNDMGLNDTGDGIIISYHDVISREDYTLAKIEIYEDRYSGYVEPYSSTESGLNALINKLKVF